MTSPYLLAPEDLGDLFDDEPSFRADQIRGWLYDTPVFQPSQMTNLPEEIRNRLGESHWPFQVELERTADNGRTVKWLFRTPDGSAIEAVLMGYPKRTTLCISSQAGCALGCTFCATGQFGFERNLDAGEITAQVAWAQAYARLIGLPGSPDRLTNIVFMGMGEPLANYDRVREAIRRMIEVMGLSGRSITVSTVGFVPGMKRLADEPWPLSLAVSLHAADDTLRTSLVPLNKRYPLAEVEAAAAAYFHKKKRRISIEWTMMDGVNDGLEQASKLAGIAKRLHAHINLIPLNPTPLTELLPSSSSRIDKFKTALIDHGANVTVRDTRGKEIDAACGQLRVIAGKPGLRR